MPLTNIRPAYGQSATGSGRGGSHCWVIDGQPSGLVMYDSAGVEYVLWIDTTGDIRSGTRAQFETQTGSAVVGSQS